MALDVPVPDPPSLSGPQPRGEYESVDTPDEETGDDYRREEIEAILADGAWADAFEEWTTQTGLTETDFGAVVDGGFLDGLDFYWDPSTDDVGYRSPTVPAGGSLDRATAADIESELDTLGRVVSETLENDYLPRDDVSFGFTDEDTGDGERR